MSHPSLRDAEPRPFWLDSASRPAASEPLRGTVTADLLVVGGGYSGLWTALLARERWPDRSVVLVEAGRCGEQASGRNGGFVSASLTHGFHNGLQRWPEELDLLERLGRENLAAIDAFVADHDVDCDWRLPGELTVATRPHEVAELAEAADLMSAHGVEAVLLDASQVRERVASPTYLGGLFLPHETAIVEPAALAWGLRDACLAAGVRIVEQTPISSLSREGGGVRAVAPGGVVHARQVALATNAFRPLLRRLRLMTVPVYDYVLMTEPLSQAQLASIGWTGREGIGDASNLFHYYRLTRDDRILWGGYDALYHYGSRIDPALEQGATHDLLARHFFATFPQLEGLRFTHRWAGVIDTCTRFSAFFGTAMGGAAAYALGYTGLGVGATRFGAEVMLDLLAGEPTERTRLAMVRERPVPFPPEPVRWGGIQLTRRALARADERGGRRGPWLAALDRLGLGFDS